MGKPDALTLSVKAVDLVSAALRHVRDAEHLLDAGPHTSIDQAYHLAAFGPECVRKASLSLRWLDKELGHGAETLADDLVDLVVALDPVAHRYEPRAYRARHPELSRWRVECRYARTGAQEQPRVEALCREARATVDGTVAALWADGRVPDGEALW
jgi:glutathione S-transferase